MHFKCLSTAMVVLLLLSSANAAKRPFTVADSIERTEITEPYLQAAHVIGIDFNWSPDRKFVAFVTRRGELATGLNHYALRLYGRDELQGALRKSRSPARPPGRVILTMATSTFRHGIEQITWDPGGRFLYCIGRQGEEPGQIYEIDLETGRTQQLTSSDTDVRSFAVTPDKQRILYLAQIVEDWTERNRRGYVVGAHLAFEVTIRHPRDVDYKLGHHLLDRRTGKVRTLDLPVSLFEYPYVLSRDGRFAIYPIQLRALPAAWREYSLFRVWRELGDQSLVDNGVALAPVAEVDGLDPTFGGPAVWINQYHVIDLETGVAKPLLDAPAVILGASHVVWSPDGASVIVDHAYLPLAGVSADEAAHRASVRMIAEVDLRSGAVLPIADHSLVSADGLHRLDLLGIDRVSDGVVDIRERPSNETRATVTRYVKKAGRWTKSSTTHEAPASIGLQLEVHQDPNTPPDVFVRDVSSGRSARILELNPQFKELVLGHVETFDWRDKLGHQFRGGLFFPPDYVPGKRLPVVLQTYGFREDEFIVDGPTSMKNAYSARALINQGMLVLQMPELALPKGEDLGEFEAPGENALYLAGLEAAIDALDSQGLIDPAKVGLVGFSREGMHVQYSVTFTSRPIAAAIISDSGTATPFCYAMAHGASRPGLVEWERNGLIGATPWGRGMDLWQERSPAFHYDRIRTPLRIEFMNYVVPCTWDTYAMLSRHRRPVELVHIPGDSHNLQTPWGRYTSQQGAVEWFNFWLRDVEDPDPGKQGQYQRWRVFREQQAIAAKARVLSRGER
jgi:hypothetical protein